MPSHTRKDNYVKETAKDWDESGTSRENHCGEDFYAYTKYFGEPNEEGLDSCAEPLDKPQNCFINLGSISPIDKLSVMSAGTAGTFLERLKSDITKLPMEECAENALLPLRMISPENVGHYLQPDICFSDIQSPQKNILECDPSPHIPGLNCICKRKARRFSEFLQGDSGTVNEIWGYQLKDIPETCEGKEEQWDMIMQDLNEKEAS